jgi:hypothetical protein
MISKRPFQILVLSPTSLFPRKKHQEGEFLSPLKELDLCDNLNLIWFDSFKIRAKPARFQTPQDSEKKKTVLTAKPETKTMPKLTFRDNQTFAEVLSVAKPSKKMVVYESIYDDKE